MIRENADAGRFNCAYTGELRIFLESRTSLKLIPKANLGEGRAMLDSGMEVPPLMAVFYACEVSRNVTFIKDAGKTIQVVTHGDRPVQVLYVGCGFYNVGTLLTDSKPESIPASL